MLDIIKRHNRLKDILNIRESEARFSIFLSLISCIILYCVGLFEKFSLFSEMLIDIILCFIGGYIGIIGFSLTGMAMMLGLFSRKQISIIEKHNGQGVIEEVMSSYGFLAFISACNVFLLFIVSFAISCEKRMLPSYLFWICAFIILYLTFFNIFYAVSLVFNCVSLFTISKIYSACEEQDDIVSTANEIRTDYVLGVLVKILNISRNDVLEGLKNEASNLPEETRKKVMEYFETHYPQ